MTSTQADFARAIRAAQQCKAGAVEVRQDGTFLVHLSPLISAPEVLPPEVIPTPRPKVVL
jgi:hypothetical protein